MKLFKNDALPAARTLTGAAEKPVVVFTVPKSEPNLKGSTVFPQDVNERKPKLVTQTAKLVGTISAIK